MAQSEILLYADVVYLLRAEIAAAGSQSEWARKKNVERSMLNAALRGRRNLPPDVITALGLEPFVAYRPAGRASSRPDDLQRSLTGPPPRRTSRSKSASGVVRQRGLSGDSNKN
jgi:hypothetical protein